MPLRSGLGSPILCVLSPDGREAALALKDEIGVAAFETAHYLTLRSKPSPTTLLARTMAWSSDGKRLAFSDNAEIHVWERPEAGRDALPVRSLRGHGKSVTALAFSPDGRTLASAGVGESARLWDVGTSQERAVLPDPARATRITSLAFTADGRELRALAPAEGQILRWSSDCAERKPVMPDRNVPRRCSMLRSTALLLLFLSATAFAADVQRIRPGATHPPRSWSVRRRWPTLPRCCRAARTADAAAQAANVLDRLDAVLATVGSNLDAVVKLNVYVARADVIADIRRPVALRFKDAKPAICLVVGALPQSDALVAMDAVAIAADVRAVKRAENVAVLPAGSRVYVSGQAEKGANPIEAAQDAGELAGDAEVARPR